MYQQDKLSQQDCIYYMRTLEDSSVNLIIADPPYYNIVKNSWDNQWSSEKEYLNWCSEWITESKRILKDNGSLIIWGQLGEKHIIFARLLVMLEDEFPELIRKNIITVKRTKGQGTSTNFMSNREEFIWLVKNSNSYIFNKQYTTEEKKQYGYKRNKDKPTFKVAGNVWSEIISCINNNRNWIATELETYNVGLIQERIKER